MTPQARWPTRRWLAYWLLPLALGGCGAGSNPPAGSERRAAVALASPANPAQLEDLERRTFNYFWETANPDNGLIPDRYPTPSSSSIAAVGFALTAYPIGVERGYVPRAQAAARVRTTLQFFLHAPQGPEARGRSGYHGFFYHFLDMKTGLRYRHAELSTIDTTLLMAGVLASAGYFDAQNPDEIAVRTLADALYRAVDWRWAAHADGGVAMAWTPEDGLSSENWTGYNEAMLLYLLGLGSPTHPLADSAWQAWTVKYEQFWSSEYGQQYLTYPTLFIHQYTPLWVDLRGIRDAFMRQHGLDYFENSRRATYANRAYALSNLDGWADYGAQLWGLTASDGPGEFRQRFGGRLRQFRGYAARGIAFYDDGTLAPNGPIGSLPFAPELVLPAIAQMRQRYGAHLYSTYGFLDAFNPSFVGKPQTGTAVPGVGWFDVDYLGIDQGLILGMVENYRSGLVWKLMRASPYLRQGLARAGFSGGWLDP